MALSWFNAHVIAMTLVLTLSLCTEQWSSADPGASPTIVVRLLGYRTTALAPGPQEFIV